MLPQPRIASNDRRSVFTLVFVLVLLHAWCSCSSLSSPATVVIGIHVVNIGISGTNGFPSPGLSSSLSVLSAPVRSNATIVVVIVTIVVCAASLEVVQLAVNVDQSNARSTRRRRLVR